MKNFCALFRLEELRASKEAQELTAECAKLQAQLDHRRTVSSDLLQSKTDLEKIKAKHEALAAEVDQAEKERTDQMARETQFKVWLTITYTYICIYTYIYI